MRLIDIERARVEYNRRTRTRTSELSLNAFIELILLAGQVSADGKVVSLVYEVKRAVK